jgi:archaellum biogenesis ATPase FlaH
MLQDGKQRQFLSDFWNAEEYIKSGIVGASAIEDAIFEELALEKVPLPPFMSELQAHMAGGIPLGYIVNLVASTGAGKTTVANECVYHWIFNSPHKVGIVSLELDTGQYGMTLLSRHLGRKIQLFEDAEEAKRFLNTPENIERRCTLWKNDEDRERFYLLDDRDGSLESLKKKIQQMVLQFECKFIIVDPLQDILDGYSNEDQAVFMKWMKQMVKAYKVSFLNVNHVRKENNSGFDRFLKEDDIQGSSAIAKSAGCNILFMRDKLSESAVGKNVTKVFLPKCRWTGSTGDGGLWYYSLEEHTLYDMETYFNDNKDKIPDGMTLEELMEEQRDMYRKGKDKKDKKGKQEKKLDPIKIGTVQEDFEL